MKTKRSFFLSLFLHVGIITGAVALSTLPQEEKEEEVILELSLAESLPSQPQQQPTIKPIVKTLKKEVADPAPTLPIVEQAKIKEETKPQPILKERVEELKPVETAHVAQSEPKVTPIPKPLPVAPPVDLEEQYLEDHLSTIRDILVKYRKYPSQAVRLKQEGAVKVTFRLKHNGEVEDVRVVGSSGYEILDDDALSLIQKSAEYFPKPPKSVRITVPLNYALKLRV